jgi:phage-related tail fiber protein
LLQELRDRIKNFDTNRGPILAAAKKRVEAAHAAHDAAKAARAAAEERSSTAAAEQACATDERAELKKQLAATEEAGKEAQARFRTSLRPLQYRCAQLHRLPAGSSNFCSSMLLQMLAIP